MMKTMLRAALIATTTISGGAMLLPATATAQAGQASLRGTITAPADNPATQVTLVEVATNYRRVAAIAADGTYNFASVRAGSYRLEIQLKTGTRNSDAFTLAVGQNAGLDLDLSAAPAPQPEATEATPGGVAAEGDDIIVTGSRIRSLSGGQVGINITQRLIEQLPQNSRNFLAFADLAPGVRFLEGANGEARIQGGAQKSSTVNVFIDGVSQKDFILKNGITGQDGSAGNPFPQLAIGEYQVLSSNYKAELDQVSSVAIIAGTKSGTNEFHGEAFFDYTDQTLRDKRPSEIFPRDIPKVKTVDKQFGVALGGPIVKDVMHFALSFSSRHQEERSFDKLRTNGIVDDFEQIGAWQASASDGVTASTSAVPGIRGKALRLSYDFGAVSGYAFTARTRAIEWPANYVLRLKVRGTGGANDLQVKFTDADGSNVWWARRPNFRPSADWQEIVLRPRDLEFAWGPTADKALRRTARIEVVVARGRDGGAGSIDLDDLILEPRPVPAPLPAATASDGAVLDGDPTTVAKSGDVTIDFGGTRDLGGVVLDWRDTEPRYTVDASGDRRRWRALHTVTDSDGGSDPVALPDTETRYLRIRSQSAARLAEVTVKPLAWGANPNAMIADLAKAAAPGSYPRGFTQQSYWTLLGSDGGKHSGLIGEDGAVEVAKGGFSIEPFVVADGRTYSWADVRITHAMRDIPAPTVDWQGDGFTLTASGFADVAGSALHARWRLFNTGTTPRAFTLALAVRPFQVNPPAQFLSQQGGVSRIDRIVWNGSALSVRQPGAIPGDPAVERIARPDLTPTRVTMAPFGRGAAGIGTGAVVTSISDPAALASATLWYDATHAPGDSIDVPVALPFESTTAPASYDTAKAAFDAYWSRTLGRVTLSVPPAKQAVADTVRTALAMSS